MASLFERIREADIGIRPQVPETSLEESRSLSAALGWRDLVGRGSGEAFQLELSGNGTVYVQASEEKL